MKRCLIIFAKEPVPGRVKTRLAAQLTPAACAALYTSFVADVAALCRATACEERVIAYDAGGSAPVTVRRLCRGFRRYPQQGSDLGERLHAAFVYAQRRGCTRTVILGTDAPDIPPAYIARAFALLTTHPLVIGPTSDGGYYLIGLRQPNAALFAGVPWSTQRARSVTLSQARRAGITPQLLPVWHDVDDPSALQDLVSRLQRCADAQVASHTRTFLTV